MTAHEPFTGSLGAGNPVLNAVRWELAVSRPDFRSPRLFVEDALEAGHEVQLDRSKGHYLADVMRLRAGDRVLTFNGRDGEWLATMGATKTPSLVAQQQIRAQPKRADLHYLFAPLKHERLDYMVQKAVEMGVSKLQPVLTQHTQVQRVNTARMRANAIEAAEQCGVLSIAEVAEPLKFSQAMAQHDSSRTMVFCDENADVANPLKTLADAGSEGASLALIIGPEGGFAEDERAAILKMPNVVRLSLGPRILRADTAAVAALALIQAVLGDGRGPA